MKKTQQISQFVIENSFSVREAMAALDKAGAKIIYVVNPQGQLVGSLSDGDIRRFILSGGKIESNVEEAANKNCYKTTDEDLACIEKIIEQKKINSIPIVNKDNKIISIFFKEQLDIKLKKDLCNIPVVIQAGGLGTRLYPYTHILPKPLIPVGEKPITELIINSFAKFGCKDFYMIVNHKKNMIKAYYSEIEKDYNIIFIDEDKPLGTGGGLSLLKAHIKSAFYFTNCDVFLDADYSDIYKTHCDKKRIATIVSVIKNYQIPYGVLELDNDGDILKMKEKPNIDYITNTGVYLLDNRVIDELTPDKAVSMPDILSSHMDKGEKIGTYPLTEECWLDMGQLDELEKAKLKIGN